MVNKVLPPTTLPARAPMQRRHSPTKKNREGGYKEYRECLRWEFGFSCAFCLLHEADLATHPDLTKRGGNFETEHLTPQSVDPSRANDYDNCVNACNACNRARSNKLNGPEGQKIIDPVSVAWAEQFDVVGDRLVPKTEDAKCTSEQVYRINERHKVELRQLRREAISQALEYIVKAPLKIQECDNEARRYANSDEAALRQKAVREHGVAELWRRELQRSRRTLQHYRIVPITARAPCRCGERNPELPPYLADQAIEVDT